MKKLVRVGTSCDNCKYLIKKYVNNNIVNSEMCELFCKLVYKLSNIFNPCSRCTDALLSKELSNIFNCLYPEKELFNVVKVDFSLKCLGCFWVSHDDSYCYKYSESIGINNERLECCIKNLNLEFVDGEIIMKE